MKAGLFSLFLFSSWIFLPLFTKAERVLNLRFQTQFNQTVLNPDSTYILSASGDSARIETCLWYLSGIQLLSEGQLVWEEGQGYHLINALDTMKGAVSLSIPGSLHFDQVRFRVGVDSLANVSGALGGALDPLHGMYWTWQNGYINIKIEGRCNASPARKHEFQFHLGGYLSPFAAIQTVTLNTLTTADLLIAVDLAAWLNAIPMKDQHHIMSPSTEAVRLSQQFATLFHLVQP